MKKMHETHAVHMAPWERAFTRVLSPLQSFIHAQTTSSFILMICTAIALVLANSPLAEAYSHTLHLPLTIALGEQHFSLSLAHWINEALMAFFFLLVGLELKRELLIGELADLKRASLPIIAALGGMIVPAGLFHLVNSEGIAANGWGIPMATDIAFAIGALSLLGRRVPKSLATFLIALAIVDDLGAVLVIAFFYTSELNVTALLWVAVLTLLLIVLNRGGVRALLPYALLGILLWCAMLRSGVHATLAGVILAFTIPLQPKYRPAHLVELVGNLWQQMKNALVRGDDIRSVIAALEHGTELAQAPAQRLEHGLHLPVAYGVIPLFALANAAIPLPLGQLSETLLHPVTLGVVVGLVLGKCVGIAGATLLAVRLRVASLPTGMQAAHVIGLSLLGGIGFTMSIFVAELAYPGNAELLLLAKTGILLASTLAGVAGYLWLRWVSLRVVNRYENPPA